MGFAGFGTGFAAGFCTGLVARETLPVVRELVTPILRVTSKTGVKMFEFSRETFARLGESFEDIIAEARWERKAKRVKAGKKTKRHPKAKTKRKLAEVLPFGGKARAAS